MFNLETISFNTSLTLSPEQFSKLKINPQGVSSLDYFKDSLFVCRNYSYSASSNSKHKPIRQAFEVVRIQLSDLVFNIGESRTFSKDQIAALKVKPLPSDSNPNEASPLFQSQRNGQTFSVIFSKDSGHTITRLS